MVKEIKDIELWREFIKGVKPLDSSYQLIKEPPKKPQIIPIYNKNYLDLHGLNLNQAFSAIKDFLDTSYGRYKTVRIITGSSGQMRSDFPKWLENPILNKNVRSVEFINNGSFLIKFKKIK